MKVNLELDLEPLIKSWQKKAQEKAPDLTRFLFTHSGIAVDFLAFSERDVCLADIAQGLSHACRFAGQCDRFYSVAEHSVLVSRYVEYVTDAPDGDLTKTALVHDATEAYLHDMTTPLKMLCPGYDMIERRFQDTIQRAFGLKEGFDHPILKECDLRMFYREREVLLAPWMAKSSPEKLGHDKLAELLEVRCLPPPEAKRLFLDRFEELGISQPA